MKYAKINKHDVANGLGVRVSLFVSGCTHHCKGCFNPETWDFNYGNEFTLETEKELTEALKQEYIEGFSLLGGEPFEKQNQKVLIPFLKKLREEFPDKTIWCWSGYTYDYLWAHCNEMLNLIDVLVDGEFVEKKKDISLRFRGSSNQKILFIGSRGFKDMEKMNATK